MCGIAGMVSLSDKSVRADVLKGMCDTIEHRGPDDAGYLFIDEKGDGSFFADERFLKRGEDLPEISGAGSFLSSKRFISAFGHRRLSIIDLSVAGRQPMSSAEGSVWISYNGEIYNFPELKKELMALGHVFHTRTDTEVVINAYLEWGIDCIERFNGMFAFVLYDRRSETHYLVRDRYGVKPLYYTLGDDCLIFASEIKALLKHPSCKRGLDHEALNEYFTFQNNFRKETLFKGIHSLEPATVMTIKSNKISTKTYWDYNVVDVDNTIDFQTASEETLRLLTQAVERQHLSDVPVGVYLSGGMDSATITALSSKITSRLTSFTGGFEMASVQGREKDFDERKDAEMIANTFKTEHYEQVINSGDMPWVMPRLVYHLEDIRLGMSYPNYYISRLASKFVKVTLTGVAGDEIYGGYPWRYYRARSCSTKEEYYKSYFDFWQRLVRTEDKEDFFHNTIFDSTKLKDAYSIFSGVFEQNPSLKFDTLESQIMSSFYFELKTFLSGLLIIGDKLSMANGLEERFPFLDNDLVDFSLSLPVRHKLKNFEKIEQVNENEERRNAKYYQMYDDGKNVLRNAMSKLLPEQIVNRKKQGFSAPDESWYRGENYEYVCDTLLKSDTKIDRYINKKYIQRIIDEHSKESNHRLLIWSFICFEEWCRLFDE